MRNTTIKLLFFFCCFAVNAQKKTIINGTVKPSENNSKIYIQEINSGSQIYKDSATITNGKFQFKLDTKELDIAILKLEKSDKTVGVPFILEEGKTEILFDKDSVQKSKISGTYNNTKFQEFNSKSQVIIGKLKQFEKNNNEKMQTAQQARDTVVINQLMKEYRTIEKDFFAFRKDFIQNNPKAFITLFLMENTIGDPTFNIEEIKNQYDKIDKSLVGNKHAKNIKKAIDNHYATSIGHPAPEFSGPSPEGKTISLKESLGKITIIDFWASWCKPCRMENPNVVALYNELHAKGLNIISISLDKDGEKWKQAIETDGLTWTHISNLKYWEDPIAKLYNVKAIPVMYILDEKGNIVAKDLRGEALKAKIKELLGV